LKPGEAPEFIANLENQMKDAERELLKDELDQRNKT